MTGDRLFIIIRFQTSGTNFNMNKNMAAGLKVTIILTNMYCCVLFLLLIDEPSNIIIKLGVVRLKPPAMLTEGLKTKFNYFKHEIDE